MVSITSLSAEKKLGYAIHWAGAIVALLVVLGLSTPTALGQCTLTGTVSSWTAAGSGTWSTSGDWSSGVPNSSTTSACITNGTSGTPSAVTLNINATVDNLQLGSFDSLTSALNTQLGIAGTEIINGGSIAINGGSGNNTDLLIENNVTLSGGGTLTLSTAGGGGDAFLEESGGSFTLTNQSTIQGNGIIGNNGLSLVNSGTVDANVSGAGLELVSMTNGVTNTGLLEATKSGVLQLNGITVNNAGGNITANGGTVQFFGSTDIQGGTLNTLNGGTLGTPSGYSAYLDGSTGAGAVTINGTYTSPLNTNTYLLGTITNKGNIQLNGGSGTNTFLQIDEGSGSNTNVTLNGGGTVTLSTASGGGDAYIQQAVGGMTLTNVNNTIQGSGIIGNGGLALNNESTINANVSGAALTLNNSGATTNTGLLEATGGGVLQLVGVTVNNAGGNITAGSGSTVQIYGSSDIQGGTLNTLSGGTMGTPQNNSAILDGSTTAGAITLNGTYTSALNSNTYILGTINNQGNIQVNGGSGNNTQLLLDGGSGNTVVTLKGGGTVSLSTSGGGGSAFIDQAVGGMTLTNVNNTIQGNGIIGNGGLALNNESTVNANVSGAALTLNNSGATFNTGLLEATGGGVLNLSGITVNNAGGNITAGPSSTVQLYANTDIQGGTLNNNGTFLGTYQGYSAYLDGSTSAGAVTINGTYTSVLNSNTYLLGTINNQGNIQVNGGSGPNTQLLTDEGTGNNLVVTLKGGGTVTLSTAGGGGSAYIDQAVGGMTLDNVNNTIQGNGIIGNNGLSLINSGTVDANVSGAGLELVSMTNGVTNTALLEATNGGVLQLNGVTVNNAGGNITAGSGSSVHLFSGAVIQGGTLTNNGTFLGTAAGYSAVLDGSTSAGAITLNGTYTSGLSSQTYVLGTINNNNNLQVEGGSGDNTFLMTDSTNVTLKGGGTVTLSTATGGGNAWLQQEAGGQTLTNVNNTIQGEGVIGNNGLTLVNESGGTINANSTGSGVITTLTLTSLSLTNQGLLEASNSDVLNIDGINVLNDGGKITANAGATVQLYGNADIEGGTLTNNGAFLGTAAGYAAYLDGSTKQGDVTLKGTYTSALGSDTYLLGACRR